VTISARGDKQGVCVARALLLRPTPVFYSRQHGRAGPELAAVLFFFSEVFSFFSSTPAMRELLYVLVCLLSLVTAAPS